MHTHSRAPENYRFAVNPLRSGTFLGTLSFAAPGGNYCWFAVEVRAAPPPEDGVIAVACPVRRAVAIRIPVVRRGGASGGGDGDGGGRPLVLRASYSSPALIGPACVTLAAGGGGGDGSSGGGDGEAEAFFECYFAPLVEGESEGAIKVVGGEAGEHWWRVLMTATPAGVEELPALEAPLGGTAATTVTVANPLGAEATFAAAIGAAAAAAAAGGNSFETASAACFSVEPAAFVLGPHASADLRVAFTPAALQRAEAATLTVSSAEAGAVAYALTGRGLPPAAGAPAPEDAVAALTGVDPLPAPAQVAARLDAPDGAPGESSLDANGGAEAPPLQQDAGGDSGSGSGSSSGSSGDGGDSGGSSENGQPDGSQQQQQQLSLTVEAYVGRTGRLPLFLHAPGDAPCAFEAAFTADSPLAFDVQPAQGVLPPAVQQQQEQQRQQQQELRRPEEDAPITVLYTCREMGRVVKGRLVVTLAGGAEQRVFEVRGRVPGYEPPQGASGLDTGRRRGR